MKAVGYKTPSSIDDPESLLNVAVPIPHATRRDLLVEVKASTRSGTSAKVRIVDECSIEKKSPGLSLAHAVISTE